MKVLGQLLTLAPLPKIPKRTQEAEPSRLRFFSFLHPPLYDSLPPFHNRDPTSANTTPATAGSSTVPKAIPRTPNGS